MNSHWSATSGEFTLHRYPKNQHDKSLQAWDSADELMVEHCIENLDNTDSLLILNDQFGALSIGLNQFSPTVLTDSEVSRRAILQNSEENQITVPDIINSLETWPDCQTIVLKLTKNLGYLEFQLQQIAILPKPVNVVAAGKTTMVTKKVLKLFERYLDNVSTSLAKKKSRLIFATHNEQKENENKYPVCLNWHERKLTLKAHANVFSKEQVDIGGRFLADNLPEFKDGQKVLDLGCGNGLLGLCALTNSKDLNSQINLMFCDESFMAVESARLNVKDNHPTQLKSCEFIQDDCLSTIDSNSVDIILCNPPFHQQNTITEHIAKQMFSDAQRVLRSGGELFVVANRHLPYQSQLKKSFGGFKLHNQNNKFVIYHCNKRR